MSTHRTRAQGLAAALLVSLLGAPAASAAAPDPVAACDGTAFTATTVAGRDAVTCDDGRVRDWQRATVADARVIRGSGGGATLRFVVSRPEAGNPLALDYATAAGTAVAGSDFTAVSGQLVLEADETERTIEVPVTARAAHGSDLSLRLTLSDPSGVALLERAQASGWIVNRFYRAENQPDAEFMCDGGFYSLGMRPEGGRAVVCLGRVFTPLMTAPLVDPRAGVATFTVTRPAEIDSYGSYYMRYRTVDGTARAGVDYTATNGTVSLRSDQRTLTLAVPVAPDGSGDFSLELSTDSPGTTVAAYNADRSGLVPVAATATIGRSGAQISGTPRLGSAVTAAAGADAYAWWRCDAAGACAAIPGATARTYRPTAADVGERLRVRTTTAAPEGGSQIAEATTSAAVFAAPTDATAACDGTPFTTATVDGRQVVSCDDGAIRDWQRVTIADARVERGTSGGAMLRFRVSRPESGSPLFLRARTVAGGTALAGSDYTALDAILVLEADETETTVELPVTSRSTAGDDVTVALALDDERGAGIEFARRAATGTIANGATSRAISGEEACDGGAFDVSVIDGWQVVRCLGGGSGTETVSASPLAVDRRAGLATFALRRSHHGSPVWIDWTTADGAARAGVDYEAASGTVVMSGDQRVARVSVPLIADAPADRDRDVALVLSSGRAGTRPALTGASATIRGFTPALPGTPRVGEPLVDAAPGAETRRWQRCDANDACWEIAGATGASYTPTAEDLGKRLRVRATIAGEGGTTIAARTPASAPVEAADDGGGENPGPGGGENPGPGGGENPGPGGRDPNPPGGPSPTPDPPGGPTPTPPRAENPATPRARVAGVRQQRRSVTRAAAGRTNVVLHCSRRCALNAPLTISTRDARRLGLSTTRVGSARGAVRGAGLVRLRVRFDRAAATRLPRIGAPLRVIATVPNPGGRAIRVSFVLEPSRRAGT